MKHSSKLLIAFLVMAWMSIIALFLSYNINGFFITLFSVLYVMAFYELTQFLIKSEVTEIEKNVLNSFEKEELPSQDIECVSCGHINDMDSTVCANCGTDLLVVV